MKKAAIVGFGRFGELLAALARSSFEVIVIESNPERAQVAKDKGYTVEYFNNISKVDFIFLAVPISEIESILIKLAPLVYEKHVVVDLCSVKVFPINLMRKHLVKAQIIGTHPMFGPDSAKHGLDGLKVAVCPINAMPENLQVLKDFWHAQGASVLETTPEEHDKDAVYSQAFTYSLAKIILNMKLPEVTFKTRSFSALMEVARLSANDSELLFHDMLFYNPYFSEMKMELQTAISKTNIILTTIEAEQVDSK